MRPGVLRRGGAIGVLVAAILGALVSLGVLPWATRAEVESRFQRIEQQVDDIHRYFFPEQHRRSGP